ncbi:hypothetical protein [Streptomyces sp. NPDC048172]|uniref:hypothetical protein n=1 Tax=Streptomyces sp. NPDC048172 TaxID=3365505 RepID=UPI00371C6C0C
MTVTVTGAGPRLPAVPARARRRERKRRSRRAPWLGLVATGFAALQLALVVGRFGLGWDETVYVSQADPRVPAAYFSAPRSRGISHLLAPVLAVTDSTTVLRIALATASAAGLYAAFRVWRPLLGRTVPAVAALAFATLWVTVLYGPQAMPNLWVALTAVAAVGWFLRATAPPEPALARVLPGLALAVALATLFRFSDGLWLGLALLAACAATGARRGRDRDRGRVHSFRTAVPSAAAVLGGLALGSAEWLVEAYVRWGGPGARLAASSATEGGIHPHWNAPTALRGLNGPLLCRPCAVHLTRPTHTLWWLALPLLAALACTLAALAARTAPRAPRPAVTVLPVLCAAALSVPYLLLLDYFAPRFLLPAYALLSLPVAGLAARTVAAVRPGLPRRLAALALAALFAAHLTAQYAELRTHVTAARATARRYQLAADRLHALGARAPCLITGEHAPPIAYYAGCASANVSGNNRDTTAPALRRRATEEPVAALTAADRPPHYARTWPAHPLPGTGLTAYGPPQAEWAEWAGLSAVASSSHGVAAACARSRRAAVNGAEPPSLSRARSASHRIWSIWAR